MIFIFELPHRTRSELKRENISVAAHRWKANWLSFRKENFNRKIKYSSKNCGHSVEMVHYYWLWARVPTSYMFKIEPILKISHSKYNPFVNTHHIGNSKSDWIIKSAQKNPFGSKRWHNLIWDLKWSWIDKKLIRNFWIHRFSENSLVDFKRNTKHVMLSLFTWKNPFNPHTNWIKYIAKSNEATEVIRNLFVTYAINLWLDGKYTLKMNQGSVWSKNDFSMAKIFPLSFW